MAAKHFMIYFQKETGSYVVAEPRPWAKKNKHYFPNYTFQGNSHPTTDVVEKWLINNRDFKVAFKNNEVFLIQNVDPNLVL
jgi:hypothetical protein